MPILGIVTVLYNSDDVLEDFFLSLSAQKNVDFRLYVIDNSATNSGTLKSQALADRHGISARVTFNNFNGGVARGNNQGILEAIGDGCEYILLANNDTYFPSETTISTLLQKVSDGSCDLVTPKIKYFDSDIIWCGGGKMLPWRGTVRHIGDGDRDEGQYISDVHISYAPTCFMLFSSRLIDSVGLMDEKYFVYYDDVDFIWRCNKKKKKLIFTPEAEIYHKVSYSTGGDESKFSVYYQSRNRVYFILKNLSLLPKTFAIFFVLLTRPVQYRRWIRVVYRATYDGFTLFFKGKGIFR